MDEIICGGKDDEDGEDDDEGDDEDGEDEDEGDGDGDGDGDDDGDGVDNLLFTGFSKAGEVNKRRKSNQCFSSAHPDHQTFHEYDEC